MGTLSDRNPYSGLITHGSVVIPIVMIMFTTMITMMVMMMIVMSIKMMMMVMMMMGDLSLQPPLQVINVNHPI